MWATMIARPCSGCGHAIAGNAYHLDKKLLTMQQQPEANYDPCADLSTIRVVIRGGTGSSPLQALIFHRGSYLGTATAKAYGFTSLDTGASSNDTVVLAYRSGQSCTACDDGTVTTVRYRWDGTRVQMLDPPPP
jgi:LppP/LprE lipoprotein